ncbi:MAG: AI-2E family transporter [Polyangiaceae bacterium]
MDAADSFRKRRRRFFFLWAVIAAVIIVAAREVMLPFVLAIVVAYVLTPLVAWFEKKRFPRAVAIITVYALVLGTLGGGIRLIAPRLGHEVLNLRSELPKLQKEIETKATPWLDEKLQMLGVSEASPNGTAQGAPPLSSVEEKDEPSLVVRPRDDGSFAVDVQGGFTIKPQDEGFVVEGEAPLHGRHGRHNMVGDLVRKTISYARKNVLEVARLGQQIIGGVSRAIFVFSITLMLAAYLILTRDKVAAFFRSLLRPSERPSYERLFVRIDKGLSGVVRGQLVICLVNGALSAVGFAIAGLKYWPVIALLATVFSLIPIFGAILSSIPAVALGLTQGPGTALFVLAWIIGIHQVEANFLNPKIIGDAAKIHPVLVVFSLLVGEHLFHLPGALLAVPCMSIAQSLFQHFRAEIQAGDPEFATDPPVLSVPPPEPKA